MKVGKLVRELWDTHISKVGTSISVIGVLLFILDIPARMEAAHIICTMRLCFSAGSCVTT
jgi:hypothetical protein